MISVEPEDSTEVRQYCTSILAATESAIESTSPQEVGTLFSVLRKCILTLGILILQEPTNAQLNSFIMKLQVFIFCRCPNVRPWNMHLGELAALIRSSMRQQSDADPAYRSGIEELRSIQTWAEVDKACCLNSDITARINTTMYREMLPALRAKYSLKQMVAFSRAYRREDCYYNYELPLPLLRPVEFDIDDSEAEYHGVGQRIDLSAFCKPVESVLDDTICPVCVTEIDGAERDREEEQPVLTKCGHTFHKRCLDIWVNDSAMKGSNACPSCRAVLCEPRKRLHASLGTFSVSGVDIESSSEYDDSSGFTADEADVLLPPQ
jgi:hypothetical protein